MPQWISHNSPISATLMSIRLKFAPLHPDGVQVVAGGFAMIVEAYPLPAMHMFRVLQIRVMAWEVIMANKKVAVVTAGGSGMGAGAAKKLAAEGYRVGILSSSGKGEALAEELGGIGVTGSNESNDDLARLVDKVVGEWGRIDVLVNSAGHGPRAPVIELSDEDWHRGMEVYFLCAVRPTRLVTPIMLKQKSGVIINISTFAAFEPDPVFPTSGVFRAGLAAYAKLYADQYAADNIRMNNVLPGFIDSLPEKQEFKDRIPMQRYGKTEEVSGVIAFLASDEAGYITGQNIRVDGGITRSV